VYVVNGLEDLGPQIFLKAIFSLSFFQILNTVKVGYSRALIGARQQKEFAANMILKF
jgi:hypothetical protein